MNALLATRYDWNARTDSGAPTIARRPHAPHVGLPVRFPLRGQFCLTAKPNIRLKVLSR